MKIIERQNVGYSPQVLEDIFRSTLFPSSFFNQPMSVRGVCFAAGLNSSELAREFAEDHLGLGTIGFRMETMTPEIWRATTGLFTSPNAEVSKVGVILHDLDSTSPELQEKVAAGIEAAETNLWFVTANDHRKLTAKLKQSFLVYLGLGPTGKMRFLIQNGQLLQIDEGSLATSAAPSVVKPPPVPETPPVPNAAAVVPRLTVDAAVFLAAYAPALKLNRGARTTKARISFEGGQIAIEVPQWSIRAPAKGIWPGVATVPIGFLHAWFTAPAKTSEFVFEVSNGFLHLNRSRMECVWKPSKT